MSKEKMPKAIHEGTIEIGDKKLGCAVLNDGTRIISRSAIFRAFGRTRRGRAKGEIRVLNVPAFLDAKNLQPFVGEDLIGVLKQIDYIDKKGKEDSGYDALILPMLCKVYLDARATKSPETGRSILTKSQEPLARASEILLLGLSNIGIIALVDEATGYQYERERDELQQILKAYISEELLKWTKTFPDVYYKEIFRLNGWDFTVQNIKKRPGVVGKWTNKIIYEQLPKGVLTELKKNTPKSPAGNYTARFFQSLTSDIGNPHLQNQLNSVITLMQVSDNWKHFIQQFNKLVDRRRGQLELKFEDLEPPKEIKPKRQNKGFDLVLSALLSVPPPKK
jgi:hypothetical protein